MILPLKTLLTVSARRLLSSPATTAGSWPHATRSISSSLSKHFVSGDLGNASKYCLIQKRVRRTGGHEQATMETKFYHQYILAFELEQTKNPVSGGGEGGALARDSPQDYRLPRVEPSERAA